MFYDANEVQLSTKVNEVTDEDTAAKYRAWNWNVIEVDGSDPEALSGAIAAAHAERHRPTLIIGHTTMAKGAVGPNGESYEGAVSTHGQPLSKAGVDVARTIRGLGGDPEKPFEIWDDVAAMFARRREELIAIADARHDVERKWADANPELAERG